jgi:MarR family 2-MHQ and catechol resistance regulon transcriptional repressor
MIRTQYKGARNEVRALSAFVKLVRAAESVSARIHRHLADTGLSVSQFGVLEAIYHLGPLSQSEIAKGPQEHGNITWS